MALIQCPECQKQISDKAAACPHCGCPIIAHDYPRGLAPDDLTAAVRAEGRAGDAERREIKEVARQEERARKELARAGNRRGIGSLLIGIMVIIGIFAIIESSGQSNLNSCAGDWHKCADNEDLVNNYDKMMDAKIDCQSAANKLATYGTPKWGYEIGIFSKFYRGNDYPRTGIVRLIDDDVQFSNMFGGMQHYIVSCKYDLANKRVLDVKAGE
jgi:hypothetical protein